MMFSFFIHPCEFLEVERSVIIMVIIATAKTIRVTGLIRESCSKKRKCGISYVLEYDAKE